MPNASRSKLQIVDRSFLASSLCSRPKKGRGSGFWISRDGYCTFKEQSAGANLGISNHAKTHDTRAMILTGSDRLVLKCRESTKKAATSDCAAFQSTSNQHSSAPFVFAHTNKNVTPRHQELGHDSAKAWKVATWVFRVFRTRKIEKHCWHEWLKCVETS